MKIAGMRMHGGRVLRLLTELGYISGSIGVTTIAGKIK